MDWKERLKIECALTSQSEVARRLGVSNSLINIVLTGRYVPKKSRLESLFYEHFAGNDEPDIQYEDQDWINHLRRLCDKYSSVAVAKYLGVSQSILYSILANKYNRNTKVKDRFLLKIGTKTTIEGLQEAKRKRLLLNRTEKFILDVVDSIFCGGLALHDDLLERFPRYSLSRTLNYLVKNDFIDLIKLESPLHGPGRKLDKKAYRLSCGCSSRGLSEGCKNCPLGQQLIALERVYLEDEEEFEDAC